MAAAEAQRYFDLCGNRVEVTTGGEDNSARADDKPSVQLRQFFDGPAEVSILDMTQGFWVLRQGIEDQRSGTGENRLLIPKSKERADAPAFAALASNLDRQAYERL